MTSDGARDAVRRRALSPLLDDHSLPALTSSSVEIASQSDCGRERTINEDHFLVLHLSRSQLVMATSLARADVPSRFEEDAYCFAVADGLGTGGTGAVASRVAMSALAYMAIAFGRWNVRVDPQVAEEIMERAEFFYDRVHRAVLDRARVEPMLSQIATTLTAAYSAGQDLFVANVGNSRAYLFREGQLTQLTRDQTIAERMTERPRPAPVERATHDLQHILTDTIGGRDFPLVEVEHFRLLNGDIVIVCTDGLTDVVPNDVIADVLALRRNSREQCHALIERALARGGRDNMTVIVAQYTIPPVTNSETSSPQ
jgi:protein phosphatase